MADPVTGGLLIEAGIEVAMRVAPKGIAWIRTRMLGRKILVLGPENSGKSHFVHFLRYGALEQEGMIEDTLRTTETPSFQINLTPDASIKLRMKTTVDTAGHVGPIAHANLVDVHRPHAIVVVLDGAREASATEKWLRDFCCHLDTVLRSDRGLLRKLRCLHVLVNKADLVSEGHMSLRISSVGKLVRGELKGILGSERAKRIPVLPCILIENANGITKATAALRSIARKLVK